MNEKLIVSASPYIWSNKSISKIMMDVIIALLPATIGALYYFRIQAAILISISIITAVLTEAAVQKIRKQNITVSDYSAVITGLLLGLCMPPTAPWWMPVVGSVFAIAIVKQLFGGLGQNFMNPALAARIMLTISWTDRMVVYVKPGVDAVTTATPLQMIQQAGNRIPPGIPSLLDSFLGNTSGSLGETSAILLILGGVYLAYRGVISIRIPLIYIGTVAVLTLLYGRFDFTFMLYNIFSGGLMLGAIYMATDYVSIPLSPKGRIIFALGCGVFTVVIRLFGAYPEGVGFSIIIMNVASPLIDRFTSPRAVKVPEVSKQNA